MNIILGMVYIAAGLFATLAGFKFIHPFQNNEKKRMDFEKYEIFYQYGGLIIIAYGIFKLMQ